MPISSSSVCGAMPSLMGSSSAVGAAATTSASDAYPRFSAPHDKKRRRSPLLTPPVQNSQSEKLCATDKQKANPLWQAEGKILPWGKGKGQQYLYGIHPFLPIGRLHRVYSQNLMDRIGRSSTHTELSNFHNAAFVCVALISSLQYL